MTRREFRTTLENLDLSQRETARLLGMDARTIRRYALGETIVPIGVAMLLRLLQQQRITTQDIEAVRG